MMITEKEYKITESHDHFLLTEVGHNVSVLTYGTCISGTGANSNLALIIHDPLGWEGLPLDEWAQGTLEVHMLLDLRRKECLIRR